MLAQQQILAGIRREELQQGVKVRRIILRLHTDVNLNLACVFLLQAGDGSKVVLCLLRSHAEARHMAVGKWIGCVI